MRIFEIFLSKYDETHNNFEIFGKSFFEYIYMIKPTIKKLENYNNFFIKIQ
jgi:hypothetical protein